MSSSSDSALEDLILRLHTLRINSSGDPSSFALRNVTSDLALLVMPAATPTRDALVIFSYSIVVLVSLFGNTLVCHVVLRNRGMRTTTNAFITNLAVSDLLMTSLNVPFNLARMLLSDWPFGRLMCGLVPFVQVTSVYVSTFTMTCIALHRYRVIVNPLTSRASLCPSTSIIAAVWVASACLSLPHAIFNDVVEVFTARQLVRCQVRYPDPEAEVRKWITLLTFASQFVLPLTVTGITYGRVVRRVWSRTIPGAAVTVEQAESSIRAKRKTIKMLMLVVALFAFCWLPLNLYHVLQDFEPPEARGKTSPLLFFGCHWLAMSSVCYNPFIYWWLNDSFRAAFKGWLTCRAPQQPQAASLEHSEATRQLSADRRPATWHVGQRNSRREQVGCGNNQRSASWIFSKRRSTSSPDSEKKLTLKGKSSSWASDHQTRFSFKCENTDCDTASSRLKNEDWVSNGGIGCASPSAADEEILSNQTSFSVSATRSQCATPDKETDSCTKHSRTILGFSISPDFISPVESSNWFLCFKWKDKRQRETFL